MLNINHLRIFYHVGKNLSFTQAAKDLYISQPGVTAQVKNLEDSLCLQLFTKRRSKVCLTEEGKTLFQYAKRLFEFEHEIEEAIENIRTLKQGTLRLAVPTAFTSFMSFMMDRFYESYPNIRIQVIEGTSQSIVGKLLENKAEIGIVSKVEDDPDIKFIPIMKEKIFFVVNTSHHLVEKGQVSLKELANEPIITKSAGSGTKKAFLDLFENKGLAPNIILETSNTDFILKRVQEKEVGAFLIERDVSEGLKAGKLVEIPIKGGETNLDIFLAFLKDQHFSLPANAFFTVLSNLEPGTEYFPKLVETWPEDSKELLSLIS